MDSLFFPKSVPMWKGVWTGRTICYKQNKKNIPPLTVRE